jgi:hypothetical protein
MFFLPNTLSPCFLPQRPSFLWGTGEPLTQAWSFHPVSMTTVIDSRWASQRLTWDFSLEAVSNDSLFAGVLNWCA